MALSYDDLDSVTQAGSKDSVSVTPSEDDESVSVAPSGDSTLLVVGSGQMVAEPVRSQENQWVEGELLGRRVDGAVPDPVGTTGPSSEVAVVGVQKEDTCVSVGISGGQVQVHTRSESEKEKWG